MLPRVDKLLWHRFVPAGQVLFEIGSVGKEFYIILKGACSFFQKSPPEMKEETRQKMKEIESLKLDPIDNSLKRTKSNYAGTGR